MEFVIDMGLLQISGFGHATADNLVDTSIVHLLTLPTLPLSTPDLSATISLCGNLTACSYAWAPLCTSKPLIVVHMAKPV